MTIYVDSLALRRGHDFALGPLDLELRSGITTLAGPNGSGKSTFARTLAGHLSFAGSIRSKEEELGPRALRAQVAYLPQDPTGLEYVSLEYGLDYAAGIQGVSSERARGLANRLGLGPCLPLRIGSLSGGQRRLAYLCMALSRVPTAVVLDEPTAAVDASHRLVIRELIVELGASMPVIVATHLPEDLSALRGQLVFMSRGSVAYCGRSDEFAESQRGNDDSLPSMEVAISRLERAAEGLS